MDIFAEEWKKQIEMILRILILAVYLLSIVRMWKKWKRCNYVVEGNEMIFLLPMYPLVLMLPAEPQAMAARAGVQVSLWGVCFFWHNLFPKEMKRIVLFVAPFMLILPVADLFHIAYFHNLEKAHVLYLYMAVCCYYVTFLLWRRTEKFSKNMLSLEKIHNAMLGCMLFTVSSAGVVLLFEYISLGNTFACIAVVLLSCMPLLGLVMYKPHCMLFNERVELRRKAYLLGKSLKGAQELRDEGGILNECVVEDARIIYCIISLFEKERLYLDSDVKLADVAKMVGTNKTYLSRALNARLSKNFCQFVNHYRVREACLLYLRDPEQDMRPLAEQCGFSSQSNFSIVFKYNTGYTPGDWSRMVKAKLMNNEKVDVDDYLL